MRGKSFAAIPALVMFVSGMLPTVIAAKTLAQRDADQAHKTLIADAGDVASTVKLGIHQAEGLVINSGAYVASKPRTTPEQRRLCRPDGHTRRCAPAGPANLPRLERHWPWRSRGS